MMTVGSLSESIGFGPSFVSTCVMFLTLYSTTPSWLKACSISGFKTAWIKRRDFFLRRSLWLLDVDDIEKSSSRLIDKSISSLKRSINPNPLESDVPPLKLSKWAIEVIDRAFSTIITHQSFSIAVGDKCFSLLTAFSIAKRSCKLCCCQCTMSLFGYFLKNILHPCRSQRY